MIAQSSIRVVVNDLPALRAAAARHAVGCRIIELSDRSNAAQRECADALEELGFVVIRGAALAGGPARERKGRHVALCTGSSGDQQEAARWVRVLARQSPRGHVIVARPGLVAAPATADGHLRERAEVMPGAVVRSFAPTRQAVRAERYGRRRRMAAAMRWTNASIAAASRRGDQAAVVAEAARAIAMLLEQGDAAGARLAARRLCDAVTEDLASFEASALLARTLLAALEVDAAEALLNGTRVESMLLHQPVPVAVACALSEVCVWRGRFEEAIALVRSITPITPQQIGAVALAAWAGGDRDLMWSCRARIDRFGAGTHDDGRFWSLAVAALASTITGKPAAAGSLAALVESAPRGYAALAHSIAIEAGGEAPDRSAGARAGHPGLPLHDLLLDWMRARKEGDGAVAARARHLGVDGLARWGRRGSTMLLLHDWPALLHIVQDAEDELSALTSGCAWVRRQGRAAAVAVVDADGTSWLASDGWTRDDLAHPDVQHALQAPQAVITLGSDVYVTAPTRYAGRVIGRVLGRGVVEGRSTLEHAVTAFAAIAAAAVRARLDTLAIARAAHVLAPDIIGQSAAIHAMRDAIARAAGTVFPVLIEGESGTGKELVARALHRLSPRRDRRFAAINCAAFTDELFEAELFGYARGAFTGAVGSRAGLIEDAQDGTLFLDEVGDLSARAQAKLLRTLQEREVRRLGENAPRRVDVRVVAATNVPLGDAVRHGRFREDLLFRLAVIRIRVPPLRDRAEDIPLIAHAFWKRLTADAGKHVRLGPDALAALCRHSWPGNVRELQNVLAALIVLAPVRGRVGQRHLSQVLSVEPGAAEDHRLSLDDGRRLFERRMIVAALARHGGRQAPAAQDLGLTRQGLAKAMRRLDLNPAPDAAGVA